MRVAPQMPPPQIPRPGAATGVIASCFFVYGMIASL